ncbi:MAG: DNA-processing protein DprA [Verrucomicrobiota bacterium]
MTEREACLVLNLLPRIGSITVQRLLARFQNCLSVLEASRSDLLEVSGIGPELASQLLDWRRLTRYEEELALAEKIGARLIFQEDSEYPSRLRTIHDPPLLLYLWGQILPVDDQALAIIGSRRSSHYGREVTTRFARELGRAGLTIVSGLARGIDTAAHQGALAGGGRTLAVLGSGLQELYPTENRELADRIAENGAVLSEFPLRMPPSKQTFPMRNRVVSGLSQGILVTEAARKSGAMITVGQAAEQGRDLYAIPGNIDRPSSSGCNQLLQEGAVLCTSPEDILNDFGRLFSQATASSAPPPLAPQEKAILERLPTGDPQSLDEIIAGSSLPPQTAITCLLRLEMKRLVKQLPGKVFLKPS